MKRNRRMHVKGKMGNKAERKRGLGDKRQTERDEQ